MAGSVRRGGCTYGAVSPDGLAALLHAALPEEQLTAEELTATLFDDPDGEVLGTGDDLAAVGVALRGRAGFITLIAVDPAVQRQGLASELLDEAHRWLQVRGARTVATGASAPRYLWPGVDVDRHSDALKFFAAAAYEQVGSNRNHRCATAFRANPPAGIDVRRVRPSTEDAEAVLRFTGEAFPHWRDEVMRAVPNGCCLAAFRTDGKGAAVGFACHSVNRAGWIGPMATDVSVRGQGVGAALLGAVCRDLALAEFEEAEIAWVGPDAFYERTAGSRVSRRFAVLERPL